MTKPLETLVTAWFSDGETSRGEYLKAFEQIFTDHGRTSATLYRSDAALVPHAVVMLEWQNASGCRAAFDSPQYAELISVRDNAFEWLDIPLLAK